MGDVYTLHITGAPPEWFERMHALAAQLPAGALTAGDTLTVDSAVHLLDRVTPDARELLRLAVRGNGRALGADFRAQCGEEGLNGATTSLSCHVKALMKQGKWPESVPRVLTSTKAGKEGWRKTHAFHMPSALVPVFRVAFHRYDKGSEGDPQAAVGHLAELYEEMGRSTRDALKFAQEFLELHADDLAAWLAHRPHPSASNDTAQHPEGETR
ncbi:hypothetical protein AB0C52_18460 [Streptomyces sp. NPDC048717]|uniref:hypothetical protein n=1 Tax=Streptomyces sp. NPDC048717 TaxID=3154928 RepID=UPI00342BD8D0